MKHRRRRSRSRCWRHECSEPGVVYCGRHGRAAGWPCAAPVEASGPAWRFEPVEGVRLVEATQPLSSLSRVSHNLPWSDPAHDVLADLQAYRLQAYRLRVEARRESDR